MARVEMEQRQEKNNAPQIQSLALKIMRQKSSSAASLAFCRIVPPPTHNRAEPSLRNQWEFTNEKLIGSTTNYNRNPFVFENSDERDSLWPLDSQRNKEKRRRRMRKSLVDSEKESHYNRKAIRG